MKRHIPFGPAEILLPKAPTDAWPVVACDQYTSEPDYWLAVKDAAQGRVSTYHMVLPEIYLKEENLEKRIEAINCTMQDYLEKELLVSYPDAMILVERTLADGRVRYGIVGAIDLCDYDYAAGSKPMIRATEGTVLERIPPRVTIRKDAVLELPHVMLLIDDPKKTVIEPCLNGKKTPIYDIELMQSSGHIRGYLLDGEAQDAVLKALSALCEGQQDPMLFAVGDGNHSLATAKACAALDPSNPLCAQALVEVVNIHDPSLDFEPIYRVLFGADPDDVIAEAKRFFTAKEGEAITICAGDRRETVFAAGLISQAVQSFVDQYLSAHPDAEVDYIHGEDVVYSLCVEKDTVGFVFPGIAKSELFPYVCAHGALPRKTFSMGEACDKRFYLEARRIKR